MVDDKYQSIDNCNLCGACSLNCPVYAVLRKESATPRFKVFLAKKKIYNELFLLCTACGACVQDCPAKIILDIRKIRQELLKLGFETKSNQQMRDNIKSYGNPFGFLSLKEKKKKSSDYYT